MTPVNQIGIPNRAHRPWGEDRLKALDVNFGIGRALAVAARIQEARDGWVRVSDVTGELDRLGGTPSTFQLRRYLRMAAVTGECDDAVLNRLVLDAASQRDAAPVAA